MQDYVIKVSHTSSSEDEDKPASSDEDKPASSDEDKPASSEDVLSFMVSSMVSSGFSAITPAAAGPHRGSGGDQYPKCYPIRDRLERERKV